MTQRLTRRLASMVFCGALSAVAIGACVSPPELGENEDAGIPPSDPGPAVTPIVDADPASAMGARDSNEGPDEVVAADDSGDPSLEPALSPETVRPLFTDGGPGTSPSLGSFAVYATEAFEMNGTALVTGCNVGVENTSGPFLNGGAAAYFNSGAQIQSSQTLYASSVYLNSGVSLGPIDTNAILGKAGATYGAVSSFPAMPAPPALPAATAGTTSIQMNSGARTIAAGAYGAVTLNSGATLTLTGGAYVFASLTLNSGATLAVTATTTLSVTGSSSWGSGSYFGPVSSCGLSAKSLTLYLSSPNGVSFNSNAQIRALVVATNARVTVNTSKFVGALAAAQVVMNSGATVTCQDGFGASGCSGSCDDGNACTTDACTSGACTHTPVANGTGCSDGNACTQTDSCQSGVCTGSNPVTCAASDPCHVVGTCNVATGVCSNPNAADGTSCSDGNACTQSDSCQSGTCTGANPVTCAASDACHTAGTCNASTGVCSNPVATNGTSCSDGNACTQSDSCQSGTCTGSNPVTCAASDQCHTAGVCNAATGQCSNPSVADGTSCSDGNACTQSDSCQSGACTGANPVTCVALDQCHVAGVCNAATGVCTTPAASDGSLCTDGNACTQTDFCVGGACVGSSPVACAASDPCHAVGACDPSSGQCSNPVASDGTSCDDGDMCTQTDACLTGACVGGNAVTCVASDACHVAGACDPMSGACSNPAATDGTSCGAGTACTQGPTCVSGACAPGAPLGTGTSCPTGACDGNGNCEAIVDAGEDGESDAEADADASDASDASDADSAASSSGGSGSGSGSSSGSSSGGTGSSSGSSSGGSSSGGVTCTPSQCDDGNPCTSDSCNPDGSCAHAAVSDGTTCNDGNACTQGDSCQAGACTGGAAVTCAAPDGCHVGVCNPASGCSYATVPVGTTCGVNPSACGGALACDATGSCVQGAPAAAGTACADNSNRCVGAYTCDGHGACVEGSAPVIDTSNPCMVGTCDPATGVTYAPNPGAACGNVTNLCLQTFVCSASGTCQTIPAPVISPPNRCTPGTCDPATGAVTYTPIAGCDPNPTVGNPFESQASLIGQVVVTGSGAPVTGYSVTVFDDATTNLPARSDVSATTASDGSFRARLTTFPTSEPDRTAPHHVVMEIDAPNFLSAYRNVYLHPGMAVNLGEIDLVPLDPNVTMIDAAGGTAVDSQGLVQLTIPAGALTGPTPVRITAFRSRGDLAYPLPDLTIAGYAMDIEPDGLQLRAPATVRLTNWRNFPTSLSIPVGLLNKADGSWSHETIAKWDGQKFAFTVNHFSERDINLPILGIAVLKIEKGKDNNKSAQECGGSTFGLANGTVRQNMPLPGVTRRGQPYAVGINYDGRLAYGTPKPASTTSLGSVPSTGIVVNGQGVKVSITCMSQPGAEQVLATTPGTCAAGSCAPGASVSIPSDFSMAAVHDGTNVASSTVLVDPSGNSIQFNAEIPIALPFGAGGDTVADPGFVPTKVSITQQGAQCTAGGSNSFAVGQSGSANGNPNPAPVTVDAGADSVLASTSMPTFVYHRHSSPYGIGWGINGVSHLYVSPGNSEAALVSGEGDVEDFGPRVRITPMGHAASNAGAAVVHARDLVTGELFRASQATNLIERVDPTTGTGTTVLSNLSLPSAAQTMAVGYVAGVRHFLLSLTSGLVDVDASGNQRMLMARPSVTIPSGSTFFQYASGVTVVGDYAYYTTGNGETVKAANGDGNATVPTTLYRFDLTATAPTPVSISAGVGGDDSLAPSVPVSGYAFGDIHGLAPAADGGLYVADRRRNVIFEVMPDASGVVAGDSRMVVVVGNGNSHVLSPIGEWQAAAEFALPQPGYLSLGPDGVLWIFTSYGAGVFDPVRGEGRWLIFDTAIPNQELNFSMFETSNLSSWIPVGATALFGTGGGSSNYRLDVDLFSSATDPTRTIALTNGGSTLTDTTQDLVEAYDANGRLLERLNREGDPIFSVSYLGSSDTIQAITDPLGGSETFGYVNGTLSSITDAANRTTTFVIDANSDLTSYTEPDGETWSFTYLDHQMQTKTSPAGDPTRYFYSATDGTLSQIVKPQGETLTMSAAYSQPPGHDASGNPRYSTSYTDTHDVTHTVTLDELGRVLTDQYTADGTSYTIQHDRPALIGSRGDSYTLRSNRIIGRETRIEVNGLFQGLDDNFDNMGRWLESANADAAGNLSGGAQEAVVYGADGRIAGYSPGHGMDSFGVTRDPSGRPLKIAESNGREVDFTWNPDGTLQTSTTHSVTTTYAYDPLTLNVASTSDTMLRTTTFAYDAAGNVATATNGSTTPGAGDGATTWTFAHDPNNRLMTATDALGNVTTFTYKQMLCGCSEADRLTRLQTPDLVPSGEAWTFDYLREGRLHTVTDPDGHAETYAYEKTGELSGLTDRNSHTTTISHDSLGRVRAITDAMLRSHSRAYAAPAAGAWSGQDVLAGSASGTTPSTDFTQPLNAGDYQLGTNVYDTLASPAGTHTRGWANVQFYRDATFQLSYGRNVDDWGRTTQTFDRPSASLTSTTLQPTGSGTFESRKTSFNIGLPLPLQTSDISEISSSFQYSTEYDLSTANGDEANQYRAPSFSLTRERGARSCLVSSRRNTSRTPFAFFSDRVVQSRKSRPILGSAIGL